MNKGQLVDKIAEDAGLTKKQAAAALTAVMDAAEARLKASIIMRSSIMLSFAGGQVD